jgi:hypothetical protein
MRLSIVAAVVAFVPATACSAAGESDAAAPVAVMALSFPAGENSVHLADLNGDGALDLISASQARGEVSVRLGDGTGKFGAATDFPAGDGPTWLDSADLNADGHLDIVVANHEQSYLTILLGDGTGDLTGRETIALPGDLSPHVHMVRAVDLDGDAALDLIVDSRDHFGAFVLLREPGQALRFRPLPVEVQGAPYLGFAVGDVNADSAPDLATPNGANVSILLNAARAASGFTLAQQLAVRSPFSVALADVDGDGRPDLVVASEDRPAGLAVFLNDGSGRFREDPSARHDMPAGAKNVAVGDIDGDGLGDIVAVSWGGAQIVVLGGPDPRVVQPPLQGLAAPWSIAIGDVNGDRRDDVVIVDGENGRGNLYSWPARQD